MVPGCGHEHHVFVLMPFQDMLEDLFDDGVRAGAERAGATADRVDQQIFADSIVDRIVEQVACADAIVAIMIGSLETDRQRFESISSCRKDMDDEWLRADCGRGPGWRPGRRQSCFSMPL